jgi:hypothetical protein
MTDSNSSLNEVPALLDERRQYEGWLAALATRRESTPQHVYDRVYADYRARLQRVAEQLASHRHAIESERASVQSRLTLLTAEEQLKRDERAELELRTHVGELMGDDAERAFGSVDEVIARLAGEKDGLAGRVAELQTLLDEEAAQPEPAAAPVTTTHELAASPPTAPAPGVELPPQEPAVAAPVAPAEPVVAAEAPKPAALQPPAGLPKREERTETAPAPKRESFDELAFLSSVVGKAVDEVKAMAAPAISEGPLVERRSSEPLLTAPIGAAHEDRASDSLLAGVENAKLSTGERPLAANVSANMPIVLRTAAVTEQVKTLKCNECGSMNYPTEWYCERCGAELAAL